MVRRFGVFMVVHVLLLFFRGISVCEFMVSLHMALSWWSRTYSQKFHGSPVMVLVRRYIRFCSAVAAVLWASLWIQARFIRLRFGGHGNGDNDEWSPGVQASVHSVSTRFFHGSPSDFNGTPL